jgi:hypothetical protein
MSDTNNRPNKDGSIRGDTNDLPDRGTSTGMNPGADPVTDGMSTEPEAINRAGGMGDAAKSDPQGTSFGGQSQRI